MASYNKVLLMGNLTRDPELRYTPGGAAVATLGLAVNTNFTTQDGAKKEETCFVRVVVWGKQAESCNQYLKKGRSVFVDGRLIYRTWEAEGKQRSILEVRADRVQFLSRPGGREDVGVEAVGAAASEAVNATETPVSAKAAGEEEVPF